MRLSLVSMALRNVARNRRRTLITLAAFLVGIGGVTVQRALLAGLQREMMAGITERMTGAVQIHRAGFREKSMAAPLALDVPADEAFLAKIRAVPGVRAAAARIAFPGMLNVRDETRFAMFLALDPRGEAATCPGRSEGYSPGSRFDAPDAAILDAELMKGMGASPGDEAALLAPDRDGAMGGEALHLTGTIAAPIPGQNRGTFVPLALAQRLLRMEGRATEIAVAVDDLERAPEVARRLRQTLGPGYDVALWDEIVVFLVDAMAMQNLISDLIFAIFMVIVLLGVANTMLMSVLERTREIGTMMAVGLRRRHVALVFLVEAGALGIAGGLLGAAFGSTLVSILGAIGIPFHVPGTGLAFFIRPVISAALVARVAGASAAGAVLFALYPALRASRLTPVQALAGR